MNIFLAVAAILAWLFGGILIFVPQEFYAPVGIAMTPMLATIPQAHGGADRRGIVAVLAGNLVTQILSLLVVARTMQLGAGTAMAPAIVIHVVLGTLFTYFLIKATHLKASL